MKKGSIILGSMMLTALTGYGAWCIYKKMCPECAEDMKDNMQKSIHKMSKSVERKVNDMM